MSVKKCCVPNCNKTREDNTILHLFPNPDKNLDIFKFWTNAIGGEVLLLENHMVFACRRVCHSHFEAKYHTRSNRLSPAAMPTLYVQGGSGVEEVADVTNNVDTAGPAISADAAKPAEITNAADITDSADIQDSVDITDIPDDDINDGDTQEKTDEQLFSWQRDSEINCDDFDINPDNAIATVQTSSVIHTDYGDTVEESSLEETILETEQSLNKDEEKDLHEGYKCDKCNGPIYRFRYSCVECANYDLCAACEARAAHPQHYLLRVPRPRPHGEIQLIIDTIRRFLTADLKSLRAEANFVNTLMDELKSEVVSEAGSDPVPDEPHYPVQLDHSDGEHEGCEMESNATHSPAKKDDQDIMWLDDDILEEHEISLENSDVRETIDNNDLNDRVTDSNAKLGSENVHIRHKPKKRKLCEIDSLPSSSTSGKIRKKILIPCPKKVLIRNDVHIPGQRIVKIHNPSPSNASGKESKNILVTYPKKVSISNDVLRLLKVKNDANKTQKPMETINTSLQRKVCIQVKRLSKEEIKSVQRLHDSNN